MILLAVLLIVSIFASVTWLAWVRLEATERAAFQEALATSSHTLITLTTILLLPAILLAPLPDWLPRKAVELTILVGWASLVAVYWDGSVVPASALASAPAHPLLPGVAPSPVEVSPLVVDGDVIKNYHWLFTSRDGLPVEMRLEVALSTARYQGARAEPRRPVGDWAHYATTDMPELDALAVSFHKLHLGRQWPTLEQASNVLSFTQACIEYRLDEDTTPEAEWPRYPIETLIDACGDCEDDVILSAAILKRMGFEVALLYYPGHCALGLAGADGLPGEYVIDPRTCLKYFYGETTAEGWHLGEVPAPYRGKGPEKIELVHRIVK